MRNWKRTSTEDEAGGAGGEKKTRCSGVMQFQTVFLILGIFAVLTMMGMMIALMDIAVAMRGLDFDACMKSGHAHYPSASVLELFKICNPK